MSVPQKLRTYITTIVAIFIVSLGLLATQVLNGSVPAFELTALRFGMQGVLTIPILLYHRLALWIPRQLVPYVIVEIVAHTISNTCFYTAIQYLPVGSTEAIGTALIILVCTTVSIVQQKVSRVMLVSAIFCTFGIVLVTQPTILFKDVGLYNSPPTNWTSRCKLHNDTEFNITNILKSNSTNLTEFHTGGYLIGYILMGIYAITYGTVIQLLGILVNQLPHQVVSFYSTSCSSVVALVIMAVTEVPSLPTPYFCIAMLLTFCLVCSQYNFVITYSLQEINPTIVALLISMQIPLEIIYQYTFMNHINPGHGNWVEILGCVLCFLGSISSFLWDVIQMYTWCWKRDYDGEQGHDETQSLLELLEPSKTNTEKH